MRLGDWLAEQYGEEGMARMEAEEGVTRWDLEGWEIEEACLHLNVIFIKDPEGQLWPFVKQETFKVTRSVESQLEIIARVENEKGG
jgi:hypothetical protein